ncbi:MAG: PstS family phosphate ABC transporter substrate-binding protein [Nitrospira sp.]
MMRYTIQTCAMLGFIGIVACAATVNAQVKPPVDPELQSYTKADGVAGLLTVAGSETMKPLTHRWESKLRELYPNLTIQVQGIGSETGPPALLEGKAQIATMSRRMTPKEIEAFTKRFGYEPTEVAVAGDALAVYVHRDNPISGITLQELDAMFCKERRRGHGEDLTSWSQLGLTGDWDVAFIKLLGRNHASGTATFFREHVCANGELKDNMTIEPGSASVVVGVKKDRYAVGFSGIGYRTSSIRPIPLAVEKGKPFVEPTFEACIDASYPLRRHLYLYVNKAPKTAIPPAIAEFVKYAVSRDGQQIVVREGFFSLPTAELNQHFAAWSQPLRAATGLHPIPARN